MVAIVSGNNVGVSSTSAGVLGQHGLFGNAALGNAKGGAYINIATGNLSLQNQDDFLAARGIDVALTRTYNSLGQLNGGWRMGSLRDVTLTAGAINAAASRVTRTGSDGARTEYVYDATRAAYVTTDGGGAYQTITYDSAKQQWIWRGDRNDLQGEHEVYDAANGGRLKEVRDETGVRLSLTYDARGRLLGIANASGDTTTFDYVGDNLAQIRSSGEGLSDFVRVRYAYDTQGRLASVTTDLTPEDGSIEDGKVYTTRYTYSGDSDRVATVEQSDGSRLALSYVQVGGAWRVATSTDGLGRVTTYDYSVAGKTTVTDALGAATTFEYDTLGQLTAVTGPLVDGLRQTTRYTYDAKGNLTSMVDPLGLRTGFEYDANGNRTLEHRPDGTVVARAFNQISNRLLTETTTRFSATEMIRNGDFSVAGTAGWSLGASTYGTAANSGGVLRLTAKATATTDYNYAIQSFPTVVGAEYEFRVTVVSASAANSAVISAGGINQFAAAGQNVVIRFKATSTSSNIILYAMGAGTTTSYDNLSLKEVAPSTASALLSPGPTARFVYDATNRLRFEITPEGRVTEHRYNAQGERTAVINYAGNTFNASSYTRTTNPTEAQMATWVASAGKTQTTRTDYHYDVRGLLQITVGYARVDANGEGLADGTQSTTRYVYDQAGQLRQSIDARGNRTSFAYDGMGRLTATTDALGQSSSTVHDDAGNRIIVTTTNGLVRTSTFDRAGQLLNVHESGPSGTSLGATTYAYDGTGRLRMTVSPTGQRQHRLYDESGRLGAEIDADGSVTEYIYDANDRLVRTVQYATRTSVALVDAQGAPLKLKPADVIPSAGVDDRSSWNTYDVQGRLLDSVDPKGYLTRRVYDDAGRIVQLMQLTTALDAAQFKGVRMRTSFVLPTTQEFLVTRSFYDSDGLLRGQLDPEGYLTEHRYDQAGRLVEQIRYATPTSATLRAQSTLAQLLPGENIAKDLRSRLLYDASGRLAGVVDGESYLTETLYNATGEVSGTVRYGARVTWAAGATIDTLRPKAKHANDASIGFEYDALGRLAFEVDGTGSVSRHEYDPAGNRIRTTVGLGAPEANRSASRYDLQGRLVGQLTPEGAAMVAGLTSPAQIDDVWARHAVRYTYDADGRRTSMTDPRGNRSLYYYDADGRVAVTINGLGEVSEQIYDAFGQLATRKDYAARIDATTLARLAGGSQAPDLAAALAGIAAGGVRTQQYTYDQRGQLTLSVDALGYQTTHSYDAFGKVTGSTRRAAPSSSTADQAEDRSSRTFYDKNGRVAFVVVASSQKVASTTVTQLGRVTEYKYDAHGNVTERITYATETDYNATEAVLRDALSKKTLSVAAADQHQVNIYNARGELTTSFTSLRGSGATREWSVVMQDHDNRGNVIARSAFANTIQSSAPVATDISKLVRVESDVLVRYAYDAEDRLTATATAKSGAGNTREWIVAGKAYDKAGRIVLETVYQTNTMTGSDLFSSDIQAFVDNPANNQDHLGNAVTRYGYDQAGRLAATATAQGLDANQVMQWAVVRNSFDAAGNLSARTAYATTLSSATLPANANPGHYNNWLVMGPAVNSAADRVTGYTYDAANRLSTSTDAGGAVTRLDYDGFGAVIARSTVAPGEATRTSRTIYDANNRPVFEIDPMGAVTERRFDANGGVIALVRYAVPLAAGAVSISTTAAGLRGLLAAQAGSARTERFILDQAGRVRFSIDAAGYVKENVYDGLGRLTGTVAYDKKDLLAGVERLDQTAARTSATGLLKRSTSYTLDAQGNILTTTDAVGAIEKYTYDAQGRKLTYTNALNRLWSYTYDAGGRLLTETAPKVQAYAAGVLDAGKAENRAAVATALVTRFTYDSFGNVLTRTEAAGIAGQERVTSYRYDAAGRQIKTIHPAVKVYDAGETLSALGTAGRSETATAVALTVSVTYNAFGEAIMSVSGPDNGDPGSTTYSQKAYDKLGRVAYEMDGLGYITEHVRDAFGNVTKLVRYAKAWVPTAPLQGISRTALALSSIFGGAARTIETRYDMLGRAVKVTEPSAFVYDAQAIGNNYFLTAARTTETAYDGFGQVESVTVYGADASGKAVTEAAGQRNYYDARGQLSATVTIVASEQGAAWKQGYLTTFAYDAVGNLQRRSEYGAAIENWGAAAPAPVLDPKTDRVTMYTYDNVNQRRSETILARVAGEVDLTTSYTYDLVGNQTSVTAADGIVTYNYYDELGRVTATAKAHPSHTTKSFPYTEFRLDIHGNVVLRIDYANGVVNATAAAKPAATRNTLTDRVTATVFDLNGRALQVIDGNGKAINVSYDVFGRAVKEWRTVTDTGFANETLTWTVFQVTKYDAVGQAIGLTTPGNLDLINATDRGVTYVSNVFNAYGEITKRQVTSAGVTKDLEYTDYDAAGRAWRTNQGDGVDKVMLFDAQGNVTSQMRSRNDAVPNLLRGLVSAEDALPLKDLVRTDTRYNLMGQTVNVGAVGDVDVLRRDPLTNTWVKVSRAPAVADDLVVVAGLEDSDKVARVLYRKQGEAAWTETATRVSKLDGYSVFATAGLAAGVYEYRVELQANGEPRFEAAAGSFFVESQASELKQRAIIDLYGIIHGAAPVLAGEKGLNYWVAQANNGVPLAKIAQTMIEQRWSVPNQILLAFNDMLEQGFGLPSRYEPTNGVNAVQIGRWYATFAGAGNQGQALLDILAEIKASTAAAFNDAKGRVSNRTEAVFNYVARYRGNDPATAKRVFEAAGANLGAALADGTRSGIEQRYQAEISQLYVTLFGRIPDHDGAAYYLNARQNGNSLEAIANGMLQDKEALDPGFYPAGQTDAQFVDRVVGVLLGRAPTRAELTEWMARLSGSDGKPAATRGRIVIDIADRVGAYAGTDAALLRERDIYEDKIALSITSAFVAKRNDPIAVARALLASVTQNASAAASANAVIGAMTASTQAAGANAAAALTASQSTPIEDIRLQVSRLYVAILNRAPERDGLEYWVDRVRYGVASLAQVADAMIDGAEGRPHHAGSTPAAFVAKIYDYALGRTASAEDIGFWSQHIGSRSRGQVAIDILDAFLRYEGPVTSERTLQTRFNEKAALGVTYAVNMAGNSSVAATELLVKYESGGMEHALAAAYISVKAAYATAAAAAGTAATAGAVLTGQAMMVANQLVAATTEANRAESAAANPTAQAVRRLGQLYVGLLRREQPAEAPLNPKAGVPMDLPGFMYYLEPMLAGASDATIAQGILESVEARDFFPPGQTPADFIRQLYRQILGRDPDQAGLAFWTAAVTSPAKRGQVAVDFIKSVVDHRYPDGESANNKQIELDLISKFDTKVGNALSKLDTGSNSALAAISSAVNAVSSANTARANAAAITASLKNPGNADAKAAMEVARLYLGVLNRDRTIATGIDAGGFNFYAKYRREGVTLGAIASGMLDSAEGRALFASAVDNRSFVNQIYQQTLGRALAPNDNFFVNLLNSGYSRGDVAAEIILSFTEYTVSDTTEYRLRAAFDQRIANALSHDKFVTGAQNAATAAANALTAANSVYASANADVSSKQSALNTATAAASSARTALASGNRSALEEFYAAVGYPGFNSYKSDATAGNIETYIADRIATMGGSFSNRSTFFSNLYWALLKRPPDAGGLDFWVKSPVTTAREAAMEFWRGCLRDELRPKPSFTTDRNSISTAIQSDGNAAINSVASAQSALQLAQTRRSEALTALTRATDDDALARSTPGAAQKVVTVERNAASAYNAAANAIATEQAVLGSVSATLKKETGRTLTSLTLDALNKERTWLSAADIALDQASAHSNARAALAQAKSAVYINVEAQEKADLAARRAIEFTELHHAIVGTAPSVAAMTFALSDLAAGKTLLELADELIQTYGLSSDRVSNESFVSTMYSGALGRPVDAAGLRFWTAALGTNPPVARNVLVMEFIKSLTENTLNSDTALFAGRITTALKGIVNGAKTPLVDDLTELATFYALEEAKRYNAVMAPNAQDSRVRHTTQVAQLYQLLLNRSPDPGGLNVWVNYLQGGGTPAGLAQFMLEGFEARDDFPASLSNKEFVVRLYKIGFGRDVDAAELQHFWAKLDAGMSRGMVTVNVLEHMMSSNIASTADYTSRTLFMGKVSGALALAAKAAADYARDMTGAVAAAQDIESKKPADYASSAISGVDAIVDQAKIGPTTVDSIVVDRWGNVLSVADPRNRNWKIEYTYNVYNQVTSESKPKGYGLPAVKIETKYDNVGRVARVTDGMGYVTTKYYNHAGQLERETDHLGKNIVSYEINVFGERTKVTQGNGVATTYLYDNMGNQTERRSASVSVYAFNPANNTIASSSGQIVDRYFYDELGRRVRTENSNTSVDSSIFKDLNRTSSTRVRYDASGNVISTTNALGQSVLSAFDAFNHKVAEKDANGLGQQWEVDVHGRVSEHRDLSGVVTRYAYNNAGQLVALTKGALSITYAYDDASGQLTRVVERKPGPFDGAAPTETVTTYGYDRAGNRTIEKVMNGPQGGILTAVQDQVTSYDAQGRMLRTESRVFGADYKVDYLYDNNGNRTKVTTQYTADNGAEKVIVVNNGFDHRNRQTTVSGTVTTTKTVTVPIKYQNPTSTEWDYEESPPEKITTVTTPVVAHTITYDDADNRKTDTYGGKTETYNYDAAGRLSTIYVGNVQTGYRYYDGAGRTVETWEGDEIRSSVYDPAGRLIQQRAFAQKGRVLRHTIHYQDNGAGGYDAMGNLRSYRVVQGNTTTTYSISYDMVGSYLEKETTVMSNQTKVARKSTRTYDALGNLLHTSTEDANGKKSNQVFVNDSAGQILYKNKDGLSTHSLIVNGNYIGSSDRVSESFSSSIEPITAPSLTAAPSTFIVRKNDTLQTIARDVWGDATLWWMIADANGMTDGKLIEGASLTIPTRANVVHNDYDTFKPYDSARAVGDTTPTLPMPPADKKGCGVVGTIIMAVVAVAATLYTAGAASAMFSAVQGGMTIGGAASSALSAGFATMQAGVGVMTGATGLSAGYGIAAGAIGGAMGSIASQAVGIAIGAQDSFNWRGVALSAIGSGAAAGVAGLGAKGAFSNLLKGREWGAVAARAALSNTVSQGVGIVAGVQDSFSWRGVAASAAGAAMGAQTNKYLSSDNAFGGLFEGNDISRATAVGFAAGMTTAVARGGKIDVVRIAADAFGNAIGSSLAERMKPTPVHPVEPKRESTEATFAEDVEQRIAADPIASAMDKRNRRELAEKILAEQVAIDAQSAVSGARRSGPWLAETPSSRTFSLSRDAGFTTYSAGVVQADDGTWMPYGQATYHRPDGLYAPMRSVLGDAYRFSANEVLKSDNSFGVRAGYGASALVLALPGLANDAARNVLNAPSKMYVGAQTMNVGWQARDPHHFSNGLMDFSTGLLDVAGAASITKAGIARNNEFAAYSTRQEYARITYSFKDGIDSHMTKFDGFSQAKGISGTHNLDEFMKAAASYDVNIVRQTQMAEGIAHIEYQIPKLDPAKNVMRDSSGNVMYKGNFEKTVYDPRIYSDAQMAALGEQAAVSGYRAAMAAGKGQYSATAGGVQFQVYLDPKTGIVRNYHPQ